MRRKMTLCLQFTWIILACCGLAVAAPGEASLERERVQLERLGDQLARLVELEAGSAAAADDASVAQGAQRLLRHLRFLRAQLRGHDGEQAAQLVAQVGVLEELTAGLLRPDGNATPVESAASRLAADLAAAAPGLAILAQDNDLCADATVIQDGTFTGATSDATNDGDSSCDGSSSPDVWFRYVATADSLIVADTVGSNFDTVLSVHTGCPGTSANQITCNDDTQGLQSQVEISVSSGDEVLIRVSGLGGSGSYTLNVGPIGGISGTVTHTVTGEPLAGVTVSLWDESQNTKSVQTDDSGDYTAALPAGRYVASTANSDGYIDEIYDNIPCPEGVYSGCYPSDGTAIEVTAGTITSAVDFALDAGGIVTGRITDSQTGDPVDSVYVRVWDSTGWSVGQTSTDSAGVYTIGGLVSGSYTVTVEYHSEYLAELYDDLPCPGGGYTGCDVTTGTPVLVNVNSTTAGIDFVLERLGTISGTVTDALTGEPVPYINVEVTNADGQFFNSAFVDADGHYTVGGLPPDSYFVATSNYSGYFDELYDDIPCPGGIFTGCDATTGTAIEVTVSSDVTGIDFALDPLGGISGTVTDDVTGEPIAGITVVATDRNGDSWQTATTDDDGTYTIGNLFPRTHFAYVENTEIYLKEIYDDVPCSQTGCDATSGTPIPVELSATTAGIDFALTVGGVLSGTVTEAVSGQPIQYVNIEIYDSVGNLVRWASTDAAGVYMATGLIDGNYFVNTTTYGDYLDEIYDDIPCEGIYSCNALSGTPIAVATRSTTSGIDFALHRLGSLSGTVTDMDGNPIAQAFVGLWNSSGDYVNNTYVSDGHYEFAQLFPGTYFVTASAVGYRGELYDNVPCPGGNTSGCDPTSGTPVVVRLDTQRSNVDFALSLATGITGTVTLEGNGQPLPGVTVNIWKMPDGYTLAQAVTGETGRYSVGLEPGAYVVSTFNQFGAQDEVYDDVACPDGFCDPAAGKRLTVEEGAVVRGVDFALAGTTCIRSATALCLNDDRFQVEVAWEDAKGKTGAGQAEPLTADSGYYWFFGPNNVELVIKVLDGCSTRFNSFWVFAAGLTNVKTEITVIDGRTGVRKSYTKALGKPFDPILDIGAFETCAAGGGAAAAEREKALVSIGRDGGLEKTAAGSCSPDATRLCLADGRFQLEAWWRGVNDSEEHAARVVSLSDNSGFLWFFGPDNVEVLAKVLDACDIGSFNSFWVFAAGLTNVEVTLRVTDTVSGDLKEYVNPPGTPFQPIIDTTAFTACDE